MIICVYIYIYIYTYITYIYMYIHTYIYIYTYILGLCMSTCICTFTCIHQVHAGAEGGEGRGTPAFLGFLAASGMTNICSRKTLNGNYRHYCSLERGLFWGTYSKTMCLGRICRDETSGTKSFARVSSEGGDGLLRGTSSKTRLWISLQAIACTILYYALHAYAAHVYIICIYIYIYTLYALLAPTMRLMAYVAIARYMRWLRDSGTEGSSQGERIWAEVLGSSGDAQLA